MTAIDAFYTIDDNVDRIDKSGLYRGSCLELAILSTIVLGAIDSIADTTRFHSYRR